MTPIHKFAILSNNTNQNINVRFQCAEKSCKNEGYTWHTTDAGSSIRPKPTKKLAGEWV